MTDIEGQLGALFIIASLHEVQEITEAHGFYIVTFKDTSATLLLNGKEVTLTEIHMTIDEAKS